jgi:hypothetical protein
VENENISPKKKSKKKREFREKDFSLFISIIYEGKVSAEDGEKKKKKKD